MFEKLCNWETSCTAFQREIHHLAKPLSEVYLADKQQLGRFHSNTWQGVLSGRVVSIPFQQWTYVASQQLLLALVCVNK